MLTNNFKSKNFEYMKKIDGLRKVKLLQNRKVEREKNEVDKYTGKRGNKEKAIKDYNQNYGKNFLFILL